MTGPGDNEVIERLIERVAGAVYDTQRVTGPEWWGQSRQAMEGFRAVARAAIEACTAALAEAGYVIAPRESLDARFCAMIDAALGKDGTPS